MKKSFRAAIILLFLVACNQQQSATYYPSEIPSETSSVQATEPTAFSTKACHPEPIVVPTLPSVIPGYTQLDPSTNLHVTGTYQKIDPITYRLKVTGNVDHPLSLSLDELRCLPRTEVKCTLTCPGYFEDTASWAGVSISNVLDLAGVRTGALDLLLTGADNYFASVTLEQARAHEDNLLAYEWSGQPLPILHGFPLRAVFPGLYGNKWVKWLLEIKVE